MRFEVPQFIDVEDKIFGPFTFRQFVYLTGGAGLSYILYKLLPIYIAIILILPIVVLALALAFYKINNKPFIEILEAAFNYGLRDKLFVWKKEREEKKKEAEKETVKDLQFIPKLSESKLRDISWGLDVLDKNQKQ